MAELRNRPGTPDENPKPSESGGDRGTGKPPGKPVAPGDEGTIRDPRVVWQKIRESEAFGPSAGDRPPRPSTDSTGPREGTDTRHGPDDRTDAPRPAPVDSPQTVENSRKIAELKHDAAMDRSRMSGMNQVLGRVERAYDALAKKVDDLTKALERRTSRDTAPPREDAPARVREDTPARPGEPAAPAVAELTGKVDDVTRRFAGTERAAAHAEQRSINADHKADRADQRITTVEQQIGGLRAEIKEELRPELKEELREELKEELKTEIKEELRAELHEDNPASDDATVDKVIARLKQDYDLVPKAETPDASRIDQPATAGPERDQRADTPDRPRARISDQAVTLSGAVVGGGITLASYYGPGLARLVPAIADFVPSQGFETNAGVALGVGLAALSYVRSRRRKANNAD